MAVRILTRMSFHLHPLRHIICSSSSVNSPSFSTNTDPICSRNSSQVTKLLQRFGFSNHQLDEVLVKSQFLQTVDILKTLVSVVCSCPDVLDFDFMKKWEIGFSQFGDCGVSSSMVKSVLECSKRFGIEPCEFRACLNVLRKLGLSDYAVVKVFEKFPRVVLIDAHELGRKIGFLAELGLRKTDIDRVCKLCPEVLAYGVDDRLKPLIDEFTKSGFEICNVKEEIVKDPRMLCFELGELSRCLTCLKTLKCRHLTKCRIFKNGDLIAALETKLRIDCLCQHGLTIRDAFRILREEPRIVLYPLEDIEKKITFLKEKLRYDISSLVEVPEYLGINFNKQIIPRYNVIEYLRSKNGLGYEVEFRTLAMLSRLSFYNLYVKPYPDCEEIYGRYAERIEVKRHPVGLWKIMKPRENSVSEEDVHNMKAFMDASPGYSKVRFKKCS